MVNFFSQYEIIQNAHFPIFVIAYNIKSTILQDICTRSSESVTFIHKTLLFNVYELHVQTLLEHFI